LKEDDHDDAVAERLVVDSSGGGEPSEDREADRSQRSDAALPDDAEDRRHERGDGECFAQRTTPGAFVGSRRPPSRA
jgi:hypothetical protein